MKGHSYTDGSSCVSRGWKDLSGQTVLVAGCSEHVTANIVSMSQEYDVQTVCAAGGEELLVASEGLPCIMIIVGMTLLDMTPQEFLDAALGRGNDAKVVIVCKDDEVHPDMDLGHPGIFSLIVDGGLIESQLHNVFHRAFSHANMKSWLGFSCHDVPNAESSYRRLFDNFPVGTMVSDYDGHLYFVNAEMARILGAETPEQFIQRFNGLGDTLYVHRRDRLFLLKQLVETGEALNFEFEAHHIRKGKTWLAMNARARRGRPGENIIIDTFVRDVSERKNAETALMASEQKYRHLFDHAGEGILIMDDQLVIAGANYAAEELFGGTSHECLTGMPLSERLGSTSCLTPEKLRSWSRHSSTGVVRKEMGLFRLDGTKIFVSATIKFNSDDCCYQVILTDITTRRQTEESLRLAKESAESASKAKSDFLANMSHEIRTPLNGMMGMLQLLAETQLSEDQREYVDCGIVSCKRLTQLLGDILDLSKIEAGRMDVFHETLDMHTILNSIENLFGMSARHKGLSLRVNVSSDTPANLFGDSIKLQQIFNNLVGNAIKFTQKGTVQVEAYPLPSQNSDNVKILFSVTDTGDGMQTDKLDHLFNAFTQADSSFTRGYQGAGLGLSIVRRLVHLMGGTIYVESELGKGTAIHFCLPFKIGPTVNNNTKSIESRFETGIDTRRILIVEDDSVNRIFLKRTLAKRNCTVQVAENGDIALKVLAKFDFDIVLMDIHMPVMGGVEATRAIRAGEVGEDKRGVPIVAVTACAMQEDKEAFLHAGMDGYLPKPVDVKSLFGVLDGLMPPAALAHR